MPVATICVGKVPVWISVTQASEDGFTGPKRIKAALLTRFTETFVRLHVCFVMSEMPRYKITTVPLY
jgi:hypothetical protein